MSEDTNPVGLPDDITNETIVRALFEADEARTKADLERQVAVAEERRIEEAKQQAFHDLTDLQLWVIDAVRERRLSVDEIEDRINRFSTIEAQLEQLTTVNEEQEDTITRLEAEAEQLRGAAGNSSTEEEFRAEVDRLKAEVVDRDQMILQLQSIITDLESGGGNDGDNPDDGGDSDDDGFVVPSFLQDDHVNVDPNPTSMLDLDRPVQDADDVNPNPPPPTAAARVNPSLTDRVRATADRLTNNTTAATATV